MRPVIARSMRRGLYRKDWDFCEEGRASPVTATNVSVYEYGTYDLRFWRERPDRAKSRPHAHQSHCRRLCHERRNRASKSSLFVPDPNPSSKSGVTPRRAPGHAIAKRYLVTVGCRCCAAGDSITVHDRLLTGARGYKPHFLGAGEGRLFPRPHARVGARGHAGCAEPALAHVFNSAPPAPPARIQNGVSLSAGKSSLLMPAEFKPDSGSIPAEEQTLALRPTLNARRGGPRSGATRSAR
jgi:hypothetical protein